MSENEKLDDHMRNGTDYVNLPAHMFQTDRASTCIRKLIEKTTKFLLCKRSRLSHYLTSSIKLDRIH